MPGVLVSEGSLKLHDRPDLEREAARQGWCVTDAALILVGLVVSWLAEAGVVWMACRALVTAPAAQLQVGVGILSGVTQPAAKILRVHWRRHFGLLEHLAVPYASVAPPSAAGAKEGKDLYKIVHDLMKALSPVQMFVLTHQLDFAHVSHAEHTLSAKLREICLVRIKASEGTPTAQLLPAGTFTSVPR